MRPNLVIVVKSIAHASPRLSDSDPDSYLTPSPTDGVTGGNVLRPLEYGSKPDKEKTSTLTGHQMSRFQPFSFLI